MHGKPEASWQRRLSKKMIKRETLNFCNASDTSKGCWQKPTELPAQLDHRNNRT